MSFSTSWLSMREPFDHRARAAGPKARFVEWLNNHPNARIADLGGGTGSTKRAIAPNCQNDHQWLIVEHDPLLIEQGGKMDPDIEYKRGDLNDPFEVLIEPNNSAITASALIDLVSKQWLEGLVAFTAKRRSPLYIALTYDGRMRWRPGDIFDPQVKRAFNTHQQTDKGFGPALGSHAATTLVELLKPLGGHIEQAQSDWVFEQDDPAIQLALLDGYKHAALEIEPASKVEIEEWHQARLKRIEEGKSRHIVGHQDILWLPTD